MSKVATPPASDVDAEFFLPAEAFFRANLPTALTFDDVSLATLYSNILPKDADTATALSEKSAELQQLVAGFTLSAPGAGAKRRPGSGASGQRVAPPPLPAPARLAAKRPRTGSAAIRSRATSNGKPSNGYEEF